ncbi:SLIT and NTRK-like protein 6 [Saccostrea cucullata]|uniref:SLIT and NTRK-like protein 6 n=1 Tax=Saccostrea cuccullata TaxID=36930 RepID=UPI002ED0E57D
MSFRANSIAKIEDGAFRNLTKLERLFLNGNRITTIEDNTFKDLANLNTLKIYDNPYHCNCELIGLVDFLKSGRVTVSGDPRCFTPGNLNGTSLVSLSAANLTCPDMTTIPTTISGTESDNTIDTTTEFVKTTYETNSSPLKGGNFLVIAYVSLCSLVKTMIEF